jgi:hypothetical protein
MKTSINVNGQMMVADVRKEGTKERYRYVATLVGTTRQGSGDTFEEASDDLRGELIRKPLKT